MPGVPKIIDKGKHKSQVPHRHGTRQRIQDFVVMQKLGLSLRNFYEEI